MTQVIKQEETIKAYDVGPINRIEQLKRLIRKRRFSGDFKEEIKLHAERDIYIETAVFLAERGNYSEGRIHRLAQEINRSFETQFSPSIVHEIVENAMERNTSMRDIDEHMVELSVTREEYEVMLGSGD